MGTATAWTELGEGLQVRRSLAYSMNTLVLLDPRHTVIVDPGVLPSELDDIAARVADRRPQAVTLLFSHSHWDHVLGRPWWPRARAIAHERFAAALRATEPEIERAATEVAARHGERFPAPFRAFAPDLGVGGEATLELGPWKLVLTPAPGHCPDQLAAHLPDRRLLFAADMLSEHEIPALDTPGPVFRHTLDALFPRFENGQVETLVPGHGPVARGEAECVARLLRDRLYLLELEVRVHAARDAGLDFAGAARALEDMDYRSGRNEQPDYPLAPLHAENVRLVYEGLGT